jgi:hypothetical protein
MIMKMLEARIHVLSKGTRGYSNQIEALKGQTTPRELGQSLWNLRREN